MTRLSVNISALLLALFITFQSTNAQNSVFSREFRPVSPPCARVPFSRVFNLNIPSSFGDMRFDRISIQEVSSGTSTTLRASDWQVQSRGFTSSFPAAVYTPQNSLLSLRTLNFGSETTIIIELAPRGINRLIRWEGIVRRSASTSNPGLAGIAFLEFRNLTDRMIPPNNPGARNPNGSTARTAMVTSNNVCFNLVSTDRPFGA